MFIRLHIFFLYISLISHTGQDIHKICYWVIHV
jgi:hypothetical protein